MARARSGSRWFFVAFLSGEWLGFFLPSFPVADNIHNTRVLCSEGYPTPTTVFILPMLLLLAFCFYRTAHDVGLGLQLTVLDSELVLLQRQLPRLPQLQPRRQSESYDRNCSFGSGSISFPPSRVKTLVFTSTQDLIRRRHESHKTIMELQSPTREATDGAAIAY